MTYDIEKDLDGDILGAFDLSSVLTDVSTGLTQTAESLANNLVQQAGQALTENLSTILPDLPDLSSSLNVSIPNLPPAAPTTPAVKKDEGITAFLKKNETTVIIGSIALLIVGIYIYINYFGKK